MRAYNIEPQNPDSDSVYIAITCIVKWDQVRFLHIGVGLGDMTGIRLDFIWAL